MAVYTNDLRLTELATGEGSGTWGTTTNTNLSLIADSFGFGTEAITTNADTHTTTIADGSADAGRAIFLQYTGTLDSTCTITIGPNTVSKLWFIENATSGSQSIIIKQGSGATVTIANGQTKAIYSDGAGSGGAMIDALQDLSIPDLFIDDDLTFTSDSAVITFGADGDTTLTHTDGSGLTLNSTNKIMFNDASQFIQGSSATVLALGATDEIDLTATAIDVNGTMDVSGALTGSTASFSSSSASDVQLTLTNTDAGASHAPTLDMHRNSASPADDDQLGRIRFRGENDASQNITYASISVLSTDVTDGTEDGEFEIDTMVSGSSRSRVKFNSTGATFNDNQQDLDFRIASDDSSHLFFADAQLDQVNIGGSVNYSSKLAVITNDNSINLTLVSTDEDSNIGPKLSLRRDSASPANSDSLGRIQFTGDNNAGENTIFGQITAILEDVTDGAEDGTLDINTIVNGSSTNRLKIRSTESVFNENSNDLDFRVESDSKTHMFFVDAGNNHVNIGTSTDRGGLLNIETADNDSQLVLVSTDADASTGPRLDFLRDSASPADNDIVSQIRFRGKNDASEELAYAGIKVIALDVTDGTEDSELQLSTIVAGAASNLLIMNSTEIVFNEGSKDTDFRVESNGNTHGLFVDAGNDRVGIFNSSPSTALDVTGTVTADGLTVDGAATITTAGNTAQLVLKSTDADAATGPRLDLTRDSASPADGDNAGQIRFMADNDAGTETSFGFIRATLDDVSDGSEDGTLDIQTVLAGAMKSRIKIGSTETVVNDASQDLDFRVESDSKTHMFFVDAGNDRIGIGTDSPDEVLHIQGGADGKIIIEQGSAARGNYFGINGGDNIEIAADEDNLGANSTIRFRIDASEKVRINTAGDLLVGKTSSSTSTAGFEARADGQTVATFDGGTALIVNRKTSDGDVIKVMKDGTTVGSISVSGSNTAYNTSSDQRLKENIVDAPSASDDIDAIQVRSFDWKATGSHQKYGMVAQELSSVAPEAVTGDADSDDMMGVDYSKLVPMMMKEIQSLRARVAQLEGEN